MGQTAPSLSATVGGSVLIPCSLPVEPVRLKWFYWQEDQSKNILFHWDTNNPTQPMTDKYKNRCQAFEAEFSSGNISIRLDSVTVMEDQKTFWAYASFYDEQKKVSKQCEQCCKSKLQVSAPYQDLQLIVNNAADNATCTARGGYPQPRVSWTGLNKSSAAQLQDAETSLQEDPLNKTFSVTSSVSVKGLQDVTCDIYNPHTNESIKRTAEISGPGEGQQWNLHLGFGAAVGFLATALLLFCVCYHRHHRTKDRVEPEQEGL
ncbi:ICOS ligand-like isoform X2 [Chelmon rostratus]|nr:ICOS ligand-like isoform X2 [Chelmon rostratus]